MSTTTPKRSAVSPLENEITKQLKRISPDHKYVNLQYNMAMKVIETFPPSLKECEIAQETPKLQLVTEEDSEMVKSLCSAKVKEMFSIMIEEALIKIMPDIKDRVEQLEVVGREHHDEIATLKDHVSLLTSDLTDHDLRLDQHEQWYRDHNIRISNNWPEQQDGDLLLKTVDLLKKLDESITEYDIDVCHRIGQIKNNKTRPVLVRLLRRRQRDVIMFNKKQLKNITDNNNRQCFYINDDLTKFRDNMFFEARKLQKLNKIKNAYSMGGNIYVKQNNDLRKLITTPKQLALYLE